MTFRQILFVLWQRRLLIVAVVVLAVVVAVLFLARQTPIYSSSTVVRLSSLSVSAAASGQIGVSPVDFDPESITSPAVLTRAATLSRESNKEALNGTVTYEAGQGTQANRLTITTTGATAISAQSRADAVAKAYNAYLQEQFDKALVVAQKQAAQATASAEQYQAQVNLNPANSIAQSNLATAIRALGGANSLIAKITNAGPPLTVLTAATPGEFQGVGPLIALAVALTAGLVAGIGIALVRDQFDNRLRGEQEIQDLVGVASLGELSLDKHLARSDERLPAADRRRTALSEGLRALRTTLQVLLPATGGVVVFTSVEPGDGKTFMSANLAIAWARTGKRVILVGGDLRRPGLGEYFGEPADGPGLTELLQSASASGKAPSQINVDPFLNDCAFQGLRILPAGAEPHDPADLLAVSALGDVFDALRSECDIVVVDSPPSLALVDATLLAAQADGAVLVATVLRTDRARLIQTVHSLKANDVTVLGVIANRSRRHIPRSYTPYYGRKKAQRGSTAAVDVSAGQESLSPTDAIQPDESMAARSAENGSQGLSEAQPVQDGVKKDGARLSSSVRDDV